MNREPQRHNGEPPDASPQSPKENRTTGSEELKGLGENLPPWLQRIIEDGGPTVDFMECEACGANAEKRRAAGCPGGGWIRYTGGDGESHGKRCPEITKMERQERVERLMEASGVGRLGHRQSFETFDVARCVDPAMREACDTLESLPEKIRAARKAGDPPPKGLLIVGSTGCGKSHLLRATAVRATADGLSATFVETYRLLARIKESYDAVKRFSAPGEAPAKTASEIVETAASAHILCLDDLGAERDSDHAGQILFELLDTLDAGENTLVATTNLGLEEIAERYGERSASRLTGLCEYLEVSNEKDHR